MYIKKQKYKNSCFPCALQMALVNVGNLSPDNGDNLEDGFNRKMLERTNPIRGLNTDPPPDEALVCGIISSLGLPLGNGGFLVGPTVLSGYEQHFAQRINNALAANENVAFVIGVAETSGHAFAIFWDPQTRKWYLVDPRMDVPNVIDQCDDIRAHVENGYIVLSAVVGSTVVRNIVGGNFVMMVTREH